MKRLIFLIMCAAFSVAAFCQEPKQVVLGELEVTPPIFAGVEDALTLFKDNQAQSLVDYVGRHFQYPYYQNGKICEGTEIVQFVVLPTGEVGDFRVINSLSPQIDAELIRVLKSTNGMWMPGTSDDKRVAMTREISLVINCNGDKDFTKIAQSSFEKASDLWFARNKPERALRHYNRGIKYKPNDEGLLFMRGLCKYELGDVEGACEDWCRFRDCGGTIDYEAAYLSEHQQQLKMYEEVADIFKTDK